MFLNSTNEFDTFEMMVKTRADGNGWKETHFEKLIEELINGCESSQSFVKKRRLNFGENKERK